MLVGPFANGKTMIAERFALQHLKTARKQRVWVVQTHEGVGLFHFYTSIIRALHAPSTGGRSLNALDGQLHQLFSELSPRVLIFDDFNNALRGRLRDTKSVFAYLRRLGREYDISPVLVGDVTVYDYVNDSEDMGSRFELCAVPRWQYDEEYLALLDSLEAVIPLAKASNLSDELIARQIYSDSEALIGEIVGIVGRAAIRAINDGSEKITLSTLRALEYVPLSGRRNAPERQALL